MPNIFTNEQIILTELSNLKPLSDAEIRAICEGTLKMFSNVQILTEFPKRKPLQHYVRGDSQHV